MTPYQRFDVVIGGGGLAGLTLARQLSLQQPNLSIAVLDRLRRPLPEAAFKVGESTVEVGAHYFGELLQLKTYLDRHQLRKFGLRYFMGSSSLPLHQRSEWGAVTELPVTSYQLDRGTFENDLRAMVADSAVTLHEGCELRYVGLGTDGADHMVEVAAADGTVMTLGCRWFVDAMGRRRYLQSKLNLRKDSPHQASAAWFRMPGRVDIDDLVPPEEHEWHARVPGRMRYFSTNHLVGTGYWVWLIPLASGNTSIGIVTDELIHPFRDYSTVPAALAWLAKFEPQLFEHLAGRPMLDFKGLRNFSYLSKQVFSVRRWACVGEAGVFLDPFYSPGSDTIAIGNLMTGELIARDTAGTLTEPFVRKCDRFFRGYVDTFLETYKHRYATFGTPQVATEKFLWDTCLYWAWIGQFVFRGLVGHPDVAPELLQCGRKFSLLHRRVQELFSEWAALASPRVDQDFFVPYEIPLFRQLHEALAEERSPEGTVQLITSSLDTFEEWAIHLFFRALAEVHPERLADFPEPRWVNAWGISLDPSRWEADRLRVPPTAPRSLAPLARMLKPDPRLVLVAVRPA